MVSCAITNNPVAESESGGELLQQALRKYILYNDLTGKYKGRGDSLRFYNKVYESGCYVYGQQNLNFYLDYIRPSDRTPMNPVAYYRRYQEFLLDTFYINDMSVETSSRSYTVIAESNYNSSYHITPLWKIDSISYSFGVYSLGYDEGVTDLVLMKSRQGDMVLDTVIRFWHDHFTMPYEHAPDTLRVIDLDLLGSH